MGVDGGPRRAAASARRPYLGIGRARVALFCRIVNKHFRNLELQRVRKIDDGSDGGHADSFVCAGLGRSVEESRAPPPPGHPASAAATRVGRKGFAAAEVFHYNIHQSSFLAFDVGSITRDFNRSRVIGPSDPADRQLPSRSPRPPARLPARQV